MIEAWKAEDGRRFAITRQVRSDALLERLLLMGIIPTMTPLEEMHGIVEAHLTSDGEKRFFGLPPRPRRKNARTEFLDLTGSETTLFFFDWSMWGNAKTGFALTTDRVVWKCIWEEPVRIPLSEIRHCDVSCEGSDLTIGTHTVDMDDEDLASAVKMAIDELILVNGTGT